MVRRFRLYCFGTVRLFITNSKILLLLRQPHTYSCRTFVIFQLSSYNKGVSVIPTTITPSVNIFIPKISPLGITTILSITCAVAYLIGITLNNLKSTLQILQLVSLFVSICPVTGNLYLNSIFLFALI